MMLQGLCFGEEAGARNLVRRVRLRSIYRFFCRSVTVAFPCSRIGMAAAGARNLVFFRVKWLQATIKPRYLVCAAGAAAVGLSFFFFFRRSVTVASSCFGCACVCVVIGCFGICACRSHWNGCMMLQGLCFGEEAGARNLVFFRVKWLQATMKGTSSVRRVRLRSVYRFFCRSVTVASSCFGCACVCVVIGCFGICACRSHWNGCMMLQGLCFGEEAGARNLVFFRASWLQATMKGTSVHRGCRRR